MKFGQFNSRAISSAGFRLHLEDPSNAGVKLYSEDGKPCTLILLGRESPKAAAHFAEINRIRLERGFTGSDEQVSALSNEELHEQMCEVAEPLVIGFENIYRDDGKPATIDDVPEFLRLQTVNGNPKEQCFVQQVLSAINSRAVVLGNAKTS